MRLALLCSILLAACAPQDLTCEVIRPADDWEGTECVEVALCVDEATEDHYIRIDSDHDGEPEHWPCPVGECSVQLDDLEPYICRDV